GGSFSLNVSPAEKTTYRAVFRGSVAGTTVYGPAVATTTVDVHPVVTLKLANATGVSERYSLYPFGRKVVVRGSVQPNHALLGDDATKGYVTLTGYKYKYSVGQKRYVWVKVASAKRTLDSASRYSWQWTPKSKGTYRVIARFAADADHLAAQSPYGYLKVY
ncbi:MAG TPA: hypothetical protein VJ787_01390, partial [Thermoleophilia bacterium]|nr:hypothetical protein [Thermoleophilia bacterium]